LGHLERGGKLSDKKKGRGEEAGRGTSVDVASKREWALTKARRQMKGPRFTYAVGVFRLSRKYWGGENAEQHRETNRGSRDPVGNGNRMKPSYPQINCCICKNNKEK